MKMQNIIVGAAVLTLTGCCMRPFPTYAQELHQGQQETIQKSEQASATSKQVELYEEVSERLAQLAMLLKTVTQSQAQCNDRSDSG